MSDEPTLPFDEPPDEIQRRFLKFHEDNPHIYKFLVRFTREFVRARKERNLSPRYSISAALERVRWHVNVEVHGYDDFKLNNNYRSRYARLIMDNEPDLKDVFETRELAYESLPSTPVIARRAAHNLAAKEMVQ